MKRIAICLLVFYLSFCSQASGQGGIITTVAGNGNYGFSGDGGPATSAALNAADAVAVDAFGNLFIADTGNHRIRKVSASGIITTVAGNGTAGFSGDGGPATLAGLNHPTGIAVDVSGNLFIADPNNGGIREVSAGGTITTVAGGTFGFSGDGGPASSAGLSNPSGVAVDASGNLFIADTSNQRIRKVSASGIITTVAGNGIAGFSGDSGPAASASLNFPEGVAVDAFGNLFIVDNGNYRVRKVSASGIITTLAGSGIAGFSGDGGPATAASLAALGGVGVDAYGNLFIGDDGNNRIRNVSANGIITTVAGNGPSCTNYCGGFSGDGGLATSASLNGPSGVAVDASGNLFIADYGNERIREVSASAPPTGIPASQTITFGALSNVPLGVAPFTVVATASSGLTVTLVSTTMSVCAVSGNTVTIVAVGTCSITASQSGDANYAAATPVTQSFTVSPTGGASLSVTPTTLIFQVPQDSPARSQELQIGGAAGIAWQAAVVTSAGGAWLSVSPETGQIPASLTALADPNGLTAGTYQGTITFQAPGATPSSSTISVTLTVAGAYGPSGVIVTVAGNGVYGYSGDGGLATEASLSEPIGVAADLSGSFYFADTGSQLIRKVTAAGIITTVAGNGTSGFSGDNGPATSASLNAPWRIAMDPSGNLFIADAGNNRIRKVSVSGIITTVAGNGKSGFSGDGGPAVSASLFQPEDVGVDASGNLFIADAGNERIRKVSLDGIITTVAGNGKSGFSGDGGPATSAALNFSSSITGSVYYYAGVAVDGLGNLFIADYGNQRIREVSPDGTITTVAGNGSFISSGDGGPATSASLANPIGVAVDASGNLFIAGGYLVRKVDPSGQITTFAGNGAFSFYGEGGLATGAGLDPAGVATDGSGNLFIADSYNSRIREVLAMAPPPSFTVSPGSLSFALIAGSSSRQQITLSGIGGAPWNASASSDWITLFPASGTWPGPISVSVDTTVLQPGNYTAIITISNPLASPPQETVTVSLTVTAATISVAPAALSFRLPLGAPAQSQSLQIGGIAGIAWQATATGGAWLSASPGTGQIPSSLAVVANPGSLSAGVYQGSITIQAAGATPSSSMIGVTLTVTGAIGQGGIITTVAGNGGAGVSGDGGAANLGMFANPSGIAVDASGNLFIADLYGLRIREVSASGILTTVAGGGSAGINDGGWATSATLQLPTDVAVDASGNLFIADVYNQRIRKVTTDGIITTVAGNGTVGFSGDGGPATSASLTYPAGVALDASGNLFIADAYRIRMVSASGIITTVAGNGNHGFSGDGGPATSASLFGPNGIAVDASGNLFIADTMNNRIRKVSASGIITTVAGDGIARFSGDGGPAASASLNYPWRVVVDASGSLLIADFSNQRIRKVSASGMITSVAGNGRQGFSGDGGLATSASLAAPSAAAVDAYGDIFIADTGNQRIREVLVPASTTGTASQMITFGPLLDVTLGVAPFTISATASSGLAVAFVSTAPSVCTVSGNTVTIIAVGTCSITASQAGDANYAAATPATQSFTVGPASACATIGGNWNASELGSYTVVINAGPEMDNFTNPVNAKGSITIAQTGCSIQYAPLAENGLIGTNLTPSQLASLTRTGTVSGNNVSVTGLTALVDTVAAAQSGLTFTNVSSNLMTASGQVAGNVMTLSGTGTFAASGNYSASGQSGSFTLTITTTSTATDNWASGVRPAFDDPKTPVGSANSVKIRIVADQAGASSAEPVGIPALVRAALRKALVFADR